VSSHADLSVTVPDGGTEFPFPDGGTEFPFPDGGTEFPFPDGDAEFTPGSGTSFRVAPLRVGMNAISPAVGSVVGCRTAPHGAVMTV